jgi:hypothetical protein
LEKNKLVFDTFGLELIKSVQDKPVHAFARHFELVHHFELGQTRKSHPNLVKYHQYPEKNACFSILVQKLVRATTD